MITIKGRFPNNLTARETYKLTQANDMLRVADIPDDTELDMDKYIIFIKDEVELLTFTLKDHDEIYVTSSKTFINTFKEILECMQGEEFTIRKKTGKSKNNRTFINCELV